MSKTITLYNVDKLVSSGGTEVEIENLGSGGTVSASGLAISRSEDSQYIDYAFNEGSTSSTLPVDGYLTSASDSFQMGGYQGNKVQTNELRKLSFASDSIVNSWGTIGDSYRGMSAMAGDGFALVVGGNKYPTTSSNSINILNHATYIDLNAASKAFSGTSDFPALTVAVYAQASVSNGSIGAVLGGVDLSTRKDRCERYDLISRTNTSSNFATLSQISTYQAATSDGNGWYMFGGDSATAHLAEVEKGSFASTSNVEAFGTMTTARSRASIGADGDAAYLAGGNTTANNTVPIGDVSKYSLSSFSETVGFGTTDIRRLGKCSGDGTQMICGGGDNYNSVLTTASKISYADGSSALMSGSYSKGTSDNSASGFSGTV